MDINFIWREYQEYEDVIATINVVAITQFNVDFLILPNGIYNYNKFKNI